MHILYVITSLNGGTGRILCDLANALVDEHQVTICELKVPQDSLRANLSPAIKMVSFHWTNGSRWISISQFVKFIQKCRPELIHCFDFAGQLFGCLGSRFIKNCPVVSSVHGLVGGFVGWRRFVQRYLFYLANHIHCVSSAAQKNVESLIGKNTHKITVVANGIDLAHFRPVRSMSKKNSGQGFVIGCVADFFGQVKGQHFLIEAMAQIVVHIPQAVLWFIGEGRFKNDCEALSVKLGIKDRVTFWGHRKDVPDLLQQMDCFVMPSLSESFGLALVEAMAMGIPVVGSCVGGIPDVIIHQKTGLLVSPGQPKEIAEAVVALYENTALRQQLADAGYESVVSRFTLASMIAGYKGIYNEVLPTTRP